ASSRGTPRPLAYIQPRLYCASTSPPAAASQQSSAARAPSRGTPSPCSWARASSRRAASWAATPCVASGPAHSGGLSPSRRKAAPARMTGSERLQQRRHFALAIEFLAELAQGLQLIARAPLVAALEQRTRIVEADIAVLRRQFERLAQQLGALGHLALLDLQHPQRIHDGRLIRRQPVGLLGIAQRPGVARPAQYPGEIVEDHRIAWLHFQRAPIVVRRLRVILALAGLGADMHQHAHILRMRLEPALAKLAGLGRLAARQQYTMQAHRQLTIVRNLGQAA